MLLQLSVYILVSGSNSNGYLGHKDYPQVSQFTYVKSPPFQRVWLGTKHALALLDNVTYGWGSNSFFQLGQTYMNVTGFYKIEAISYTVQYLAAGAYHSLALTSAGQVLSWGSNTYGQLGRVSKEPSPVPTVIDPATFGGEAVYYIAASGDLSVARTASGSVFVFGRCQPALCGQIGEVNFTRPTRVHTQLNASRVWLGYQSVFIETAAGELFAAGKNDKDQLCFSAGENDYPDGYQVEMKLISGERPRKVAPGRSHTIVTIGTTAFGCGERFAARLQKIFENVGDIAVSANGSLYLRQGFLITSGEDRKGELGLGLGIQGEKKIPTVQTKVSCQEDYTIVFGDVEPGETNVNIIYIVLGSIGGCLIVIGAIFLIKCYLRNKQHYHKFQEPEPMYKVSW